MSIFVNKDTKVLVQGITGREGQFHARQCIAYGTQVVAGVTPGKGGQKMDDVPVYNNVATAKAASGADCSLIFVPPPFAADAILEAIDARNTVDRGHHRRHSGIGHDAGQKLSEVFGIQADRSQLPGHHYPRRVQGRHYARSHA